MPSNIKDKDNIQAGLVLVTLLNVIFRQGMSAPWLADRFQLEAQQQEYRQLLMECYGIEFGQEFDDIFKQHDSELGREAVGWITQIQGWFAYWNPRRLGLVRTRRNALILGDYLNNDRYSAVIGTVDPFLRGTLAWVNLLSFIPRLSLNTSLMAYHLSDSSNLAALEETLPKFTRFRAHWTRFWWEAINDIYWILISIAFCCMLTGGALTLVSLYVSLMAQSLDLFFSAARAYVDMHRIYTLAYDLSIIDPDCPIQAGLNKKIHFELLACAYNIFHFVLLMIALCLTLPSMAAVSTMLPVIGGTVSMLMTVISPYVQEYFSKIRQQIYEPRPTNDEENIPRHYSRIGII